MINCFSWFSGLTGCWFLGGLRPDVALFCWELTGAGVPLLMASHSRAPPPGLPFHSLAEFSFVPGVWVSRGNITGSQLFTSCLLLLSLPFEESDHVTKPRLSVGRSYTKVWTLGDVVTWRPQQVTKVYLND